VVLIHRHEQDAEAPSVGRLRLLQKVNGVHVLQVEVDRDQREWLSRPGGSLHDVECCWRVADGEDAVVGPEPPYQRLLCRGVLAVRLCLIRTANVGHRWRMEITMNTSDELLTTAEVALISRAPVSTVRYWRHLGTGPRSFRLGRRVVYIGHEVEQWLPEQEMSDASATAS
jgi:hypothetical protein